jgi:hypothetical protein
MAAPTRTGVAPAGRQTARLVECQKSKHHGHHPQNEDCPYCEPYAYVPSADAFSYDFKPIDLSKMWGLFNYPAPVAPAAPSKGVVGPRVIVHPAPKP